VSVLLDTHTFLWYSAADPQLSPAALDVVLDSSGVDSYCLTCDHRARMLNRKNLEE
jgi:PIN domain nuclease of toxin-antitoxin system